MLLCSMSGYEKSAVLVRLDILSVRQMGLGGDKPPSVLYS